MLAYQLRLEPQIEAWKWLSVRSEVLMRLPTSSLVIGMLTSLLLMTYESSLNNVPRALRVYIIEMV